MPTIYDIARRVELSPATVSRALNGSRMVSDAVRTRVGQVAADLGYRARGVRRPRARAILNVRLVLPCPVGGRELGLFYDVAELIDGLRLGLGDGGLQVVCDVAGPGYDPFPHKKGGDTDAFVFAFNRPAPAVVQALRAAKRPFVVLNRWVDGLPCLGVDHDGAFRALLELLVRGGCRRPVFLGLEASGEVMEARNNAFVRAVQGVLPEGDGLVREVRGLEAIRGKMVAGLADDHDAILCANDIVGAVVLAELQRAGVAVPGQVAVTGFDDSPVRALTRPVLTTYSLPVAALARTAGERLRAEVVEGAAPEASKLLPGRLVVGDSTRPAAGG